MSRTQVERVLDMLRQGPVCGTTFLEAYIPRYSARIYDLRTAGHKISSRPCQNIWHGHETSQTVFELEDQDQLSLSLDLGVSE